MERYSSQFMVIETYRHFIYYKSYMNGHYYIYIYRLYIYIERAITFNPGTEKGVYKIVEKRETVMIPHYLMLRDSIYLEGGIVKDETFRDSKSSLDI